MLLCYKSCPICGSKMDFHKRVKEKCPSLKMNSFSFYETLCFQAKHHKFYQITSLYSERLYESVTFYPSLNRAAINYVASNSELEYADKNSSKVETIYINKLLIFDYPKLEKIQIKISSLALFL